MDSKIGRFLQVDPLFAEYPTVSQYHYCLNNPLIYVDPDGKSTHTNSDGDVIAVYDDGDLNIYKHDIDDDEKVVYPLHKSEGEVMGKTEFWDEFLNDEGEITKGTIIEFGKSWEPLLSLHIEQASDMNLYEIYTNSKVGKLFDIKSRYNRANKGRMLNGVYISGRSAGNYLAGYIASRSSLGPIKLTFDKYMRLAGSYHTGDLTNMKVVSILSGATEPVAPPPWYGEVEKAGRWIKKGWENSRRHK